MIKMYRTEMIFNIFISFLSLSFSLLKKKQKSKTAPASLKKLAFVRLSRPNSQASLLKQGRHLTPHSLIFWLIRQGRKCNGKMKVCKDKEMLNAVCLSF
jgi:hypothetical protein